MTTAVRILVRYTLKTINFFAFLALTGLAAGMIMSHGETTHSLGDFLAPIVLSGLFLIALVWLWYK